MRSGTALTSPDCAGALTPSDSASRSAASFRANPIVRAGMTAMPTPKERLTHLLELAASGAGERATLATELTDLLLDWPAQYPAAMRATFEARLGEKGGGREG